MARRPVKFLTDLSTRRQIFKTDVSGNVTFDVSGSSDTAGYVSSSYPITGAAGFIGDLYGSASYAHEAYTYTSGSISGSGLPSSPVILKDPLVIGSITASTVQATEGFTGNLYGTASYAQYALNSQNVAIGDELYSFYARLKYQEVGYFDGGGSKLIVLPELSGGLPRFPTASLDFINVNVQVKEDGRWVNDILSCQTYVSGGSIVVELSAPAMNEANQYKLLVSNENPEDFLIG